MALWTVHGNGRRPADEGTVGPDERLNWPLTVTFGLQHLLAVFGATVLVPRLTGLPVATTLLLSGVGTLLFLLATRNRVPGYLGASSAFVVPLTAAADQTAAAPAALLGGILIVGLVVTAVGVAVKALGVRLLESAMPPVVTGAVILLVALSLAPQAVSEVERQPSSAAVALITVVLLVLLVRGLASRVCVLAGVAAGWVYAGIGGLIDPARVAALREASWFGLPNLVNPQLQLSTVPFVLPLVLVLVAQQVGVVKVVSAMTGHDLDGSVGDALIGGGLATTLSGSAGGSGLVAYAESAGTMAVTRVYSTAACMVAAVAAVALSFCPKFVALLGTIPSGVVGGCTLVLLGTVALLGIRIWLDARVDVVDPVNLCVLGTALIAAVGDLTLSFGDIRVGGLVWGSAGIVLGYPLLRWLADTVAAARRR